MYNNGCKNILIYCLDKETYNICNNRNIFLKLDSVDHSKKFTDYSDHKEFLDINNNKIRYIKEFLDYGFDVLYKILMYIGKLIHYHYYLKNQMY